MNSFLPYLTLLVCPLAMGVMMILMMRRSHATETDHKSASASADGQRAQQGIRYVRNRRPSAIRVWVVAGASFHLAERGSPGDVLPLPGPALDDPEVVAYLNLDWIEEVDEAVYAPRAVLAAPNGAQRAGSRVRTRSEPAGES